MARAAPRRALLAPSAGQGALLPELRGAVEGVAAGDCFVFGGCSPAHGAALDALGNQLAWRDMRQFWCVDAALNVRRPHVAVDAAELEADGVRRLRERHQIARVSVLMIADDFVWSLGRVVEVLHNILATHVVMLIAGPQAAMLETLWLDELQRGQRYFAATRMNTPASAWARFHLRRLHSV